MDTLKTTDDLLSGDAVKLTFTGDVTRSLLIVDDDAPFRTRLARAMEKRGFNVVAVDCVQLGIEVAQESAPAFAVVDLRLGDGNGLDVVSALRDARPDARVVMLTGYGNIATAVAAVKAGAVDYLPKPADADAVEVERRDLLGRAPAQVLVIRALHHAVERLVRLAHARFGEALVLIHAPARPAECALDGILLIAARVHERRQLVEREHDVGADLVLDVHRDFRGEAVQ